MKIGVLGTGNVGGTLGRRWADLGHQVVFGSRDPSSERVRQLLAAAGNHACAGSWQEAVAAGEVVLLAVPWGSAQQVIHQAGSWEGKILIDCINPLNADFSDLDLGFTDSASENVARWARGAQVVKAFNAASASTMAHPRYGDRRATLFYCGDDADAKAVVAHLAQELDFQPVDVGPLRNARYLEPLAMLYIYLAQSGWGSNCAFSFLTR